MTIEQLAAMLQGTGIPFAYDHLRKGKARSRRLSVICCREAITSLQTAGYILG